MTQTIESLTAELSTTEYDLVRAQNSLDGKILEVAKFTRLIKRVDDKQTLLDYCRDNGTEIPTRVNPNSRKETVMKPATKSCSIDTLQDALIEQKSAQLDALYTRIESLQVTIEDLRAAIANVDRINLFARVLGETKNVFDMIAKTVNALADAGYSVQAQELTSTFLRGSFRNELAVQDALEASVRLVEGVYTPSQPAAVTEVTPETAPEPEPVAAAPASKSKKS